MFAGGTYSASAFTQGVPANIGLFLSGHVHQFEYVDFKDQTKNAPQLIVGMGGTLLDPNLNTGVVPTSIVPPTGPSANSTYAQPDVPFADNEITGSVMNVIASKTFGHDEFGFAVLDAKRDNKGEVNAFDAAVYKASSTMAGHCLITLRPSRNIKCDF